MTDIVTLEHKIAKIGEYLEQFSWLLETRDVDILNDKKNILSLERAFQLLVDEAIDANTCIIFLEKIKEPVLDYRSTFLILVDRKILGSELGNAIAPSVGLRNMIVHRYEKADLSRMLSDMRKSVALYAEYLKDIKKYLKKIA